MSSRQSAAPASFAPLPPKIRGIAGPAGCAEEAAGAADDAVVVAGVAGASCCCCCCCSGGGDLTMKHPATDAENTRARPMSMNLFMMPYPCRYDGLRRLTVTQSFPHAVPCGSRLSTLASFDKGSCNPSPSIPSCKTLKPRYKFIRGPSCKPPRVQEKPHALPPISPPGKTAMSSCSNLDDSLQDSPRNASQ